MNGIKHKILTQGQVDAAFSKIAEVSARQKLHATLVGGLAMQAYGSDRLTVDVDVIVEKLPVGEDFPVVHLLNFGGVSTIGPENTPVDFIVRNDHYAKVFREALKKRVKIPGIPLPVVRSDYLAVMKLIAGRKKDEDDLRRLILEGNLDLPATKKLVVRLLGVYAGDQFDSFVREAIWLRSEGRL